jgi:outer membrane immunogenic protein
MRNLTIPIAAATLTLTLSHLAAAADLPVRPPPPMLAAPVLSWNGFYFGLNAGATWSNNNSVETTSTPVGGFADGIGPGSYAAASAAGATGAISVGHNAGFIGGAQIGYNFQFGASWVAGLEADIQGVGNSKHTGTISTVSLPSSAGPFGAGLLGTDTINTQITSSRQIDYLGTVRGRLGYLWSPFFLMYGTGGLAYGGVKASTSIAQANNDCANFPGACIAAGAVTGGAISKTRTGWTAGGGLEYMFEQGWSAKVEYLYYDLGHVTYSAGSLVTTGDTSGLGGPAIVSSSSTTKFTGNIVRAGVNYHF